MKLTILSPVLPENRNKRTLKSMAKSINENSFSQKDVFDDDFVKFENANCRLTPPLIILSYLWF